MLGTPSLDRFSCGLPDAQEAPVVAYCDICHAELYAGDPIYLVDGCMICASLDCLEGYTGAIKMTVEEAREVSV